MKAARRAELQLTEFDAQSATWQKIETWLRTKLHALRERNDSLSLDEASTIAIRAEIAVVKELLALAPSDARKPFLVNIPGGDEVLPRQEEDTI